MADLDKHVNKRNKQRKERIEEERRMDERRSNDSEFDAKMRNEEEEKARPKGDIEMVTDFILSKTTDDGFPDESEDGPLIDSIMAMRKSKVDDTVCTQLFHSA
jgi:hypothetical protein